MKKIVVAALAALLLAMPVHAAEVGIRSDKGSGKIMSTKIDGQTVRVDVTVSLYDGKEPLRQEYVTIAMYGPTQPGWPCAQRQIGGQAYYSYYLDQVRTGNNGEVDFSFVADISAEEECYLFFSGYGVEEPFELEVLLPPADPQETEPMDRPGASGGGGGGGGSSSVALPGAIPAQDKTDEDSDDSNSSEISFRDLPSGHWAYQDCVTLYRRGIITGDGDGSIRPSDFIKREEIAAVLAKAFGLTASGADFQMDDTSSAWAKDYIAAAVENGVMMEDANGTYRGASYATRAETVTMINRCAGLSGSAESVVAFRDAAEIPAYSIPAFAALVEKGVINGYEDNTVRPNNNITRAEVFKIIARILEEGLL